jgi:hypothetical protein
MLVQPTTFAIDSFPLGSLSISGSSFCLIGEHHLSYSFPSVTEEFGTLPTPLVGAAQIQEMAVWRHYQEIASQVQNGIPVPKEDVDFSRELMSMYSERKLSVFFRNTTKWKSSVAKRGFLAFLSALDALEKC